jgi:hypothetical protein
MTVLIIRPIISDIYSCLSSQRHFISSRDLCEHTIQIYSAKKPNTYISHIVCCNSHDLKVIRHDMSAIISQFYKIVMSSYIIVQVYIQGTYCIRTCIVLLIRHNNHRYQVASRVSYNRIKSKLCIFTSVRPLPQFLVYTDIFV